MRTRARITLAGLLLGATLVGGAAWATIPSAGGVIDGCYRTSTDDQKGQLRVVEDPANCRSNELAIQWNQEGQKGDTGAQGIQGVQGEVGATGAEGPKGDRGDTGAAGRDGANGVDGTDGQPGTDGVDGTNGADGAPGAQGPAGPQGPPGAGSGGLADLDTLEGIACNAAGTPGAVEVAYGPPPVGAVTLACKPTAMPTLTVTKLGAGSGTVTSDVAGISCGSTCSHGFTTATVVTLTATSADDLFTGWSGACSGTGSCTVTMDAARSVTATFAVGVELSTYQSGGSAGGGGTGAWAPPAWHTYSTLSSSPAGLSCEYHYPSPLTCGGRFAIGTTVTITSSYPTIAWGGACAGATGTTCTLTLNEDKSLTALYSV